MTRLWPFLLAMALTTAAPRGVLLENLTWQEAAKVLTPTTVVVIPIGAQSKEHGPHLKLKNDFLIAEYLKQRVLEQADVVVAPTVNYHYYPAFIDYPGSTTLSLETSRDLLVDICRSLHRHGPAKFYALNTGVSTLRPLKLSAELLAKEGIILRYTDLLNGMAPIEKAIGQQEGGTHADEIETSMMLFIAPETVEMTKALKDYHPGDGPLTRDPKGRGVYSASGIYGDATLATRAKGEQLVLGLTAAILSEIRDLQQQR